jgi:hypothetical protein
MTSVFQSGKLSLMSLWVNDLDWRLVLAREEAEASLDIVEEGSYQSDL